MFFFPYVLVLPIDSSGVWGTLNLFDWKAEDFFTGGFVLSLSDQMRLKVDLFVRVSLG